jgi:3-oxoacyl-[acyl-carrier protein] reductase
MTLALVTGAARGIGQVIGARLHADGHGLVLVDRDEAVNDVAQQLGATAVQADLTTVDGREAVLAAVQDLGGGLDVLVNNAGITRDGLVGRLAVDDVRAVLRVNLGAVYEVTELLAPVLRPGGAVVSMSSRSYLGNVGQFNYAASKGGVVGLTRAFALQFAPDVRVNAVAPGFINTDMTAAVPEHVRARVVDAIPFGRAGEPEEVAEAVSWLASTKASYVTGQVLFVCGGRSYA